ncbi:hypothetical protein [Streptomyces sp. H34-S4]|uniref:hypothetical protein n=1 Tax=Streptomyces sp. H34-S4 TaxID=2996463 RepID=UPI00226F1E7E|nr:hypothetical protein [Streptomyces sp. H34-S4]MCY0937733.1 hypothetical protein [Streptomyces sp. H34-S4]
MVQQKAAIVLDADSRHLTVPYGQSIKITGKAVRRASDGTLKPVPVGTPLQPGTATVGADGRFARTLQGYNNQVSTTWMYERSYPWLQYVHATTQVDIQYPTSFSGFTARIDAANRVTVTGTLNHKAPTWKGYGGQPVFFYFLPAGSSTPTYMGQATTAADGTFRRAFTSDRTGTWSAQYRDSDTKHLNSASRLDEVAVTP